MDTFYYNGIYIEICSGVNIYAACFSAFKLSQELKTNVVFTFNDTLLIVKPEKQYAKTYRVRRLPHTTPDAPAPVERVASQTAGSFMRRLATVGALFAISPKRK